MEWNFFVKILKIAHFILLLLSYCANLRKNAYNIMFYLHIDVSNPTGIGLDPDGLRIAEQFLCWVLILLSSYVTNLWWQMLYLV